MRRDIPDDGLRKVVDERELHAPVLVELGHRFGGDHRHERHAIHVIRDGFGLIDAVVDPSCPRGGLQSLRDVQEVDRASGG